MSVCAFLHTQILHLQRNTLLNEDRPGQPSLQRVQQVLQESSSSVVGK